MKEKFRLTLTPIYKIIAIKDFNVYPYLSYLNIYNFFTSCSFLEHTWVNFYLKFFDDPVFYLFARGKAPAISSAYHLSSLFICVRRFKDLEYVAVFVTNLDFMPALLPSFVPFSYEFLEILKKEERLTNYFLVGFLRRIEENFWILSRLFTEEFPYIKHLHANEATFPFESQTALNFLVLRDSIKCLDSLKLDIENNANSFFQ